MKYWKAARRVFYLVRVLLRITGSELKHVWIICETAEKLFRASHARKPRWTVRDKCSMLHAHTANDAFASCCRKTSRPRSQPTYPRRITTRVSKTIHYLHHSWTLSILRSCIIGPRRRDIFFFLRHSLYSDAVENFV